MKKIFLIIGILLMAFPALAIPPSPPPSVLDTGSNGYADVSDTVVVADTNETKVYIALFTAATGNLALKTDAALYYNATTGVLTATGFAGPLTGNASTSSALAADPTDCSSLGLATAIDASGNLTCGYAIGTDVPGISGTPTSGQLAEWYQDGTTWKIKSGGAKIASTDGITFTVDGGGSAFTTGLKACTTARFAMDITGWTLINTPSATITIDVWKDTTAAWIAGTLVNADSMCNGHEPATSATLGATDADLADWTTAKLSVAVGDVVCFNVDANDSATWAQLVLTGTRK